MKHPRILFLIFAITTSFFFVNAHRELSSFVTNTDLGTIPLYKGRLSGFKILDAFVKANPGLPEDLKTTSPLDRPLFIKEKHDNGAIIGVNLFGGEYFGGTVEVTFNTGPATSPATP